MLTFSHSSYITFTSGVALCDIFLKENKTCSCKCHIFSSEAQKTQKIYLNHILTYCYTAIDR